MRLGGPVSSKNELGQYDPDEWVRLLMRRGYRAAYSPVESSVSDDTVKQFRDAAAAADIVIAEVGAWSNPISGDDAVRSRALDYCKAQLALADLIDARCCVNIAGSRSEKWDGPHSANLSTETFDLIVESVRSIIDAVRPTRTFYTLETMPWIFPDSAQRYLDLVRAIDRRQFAVHLDPVNLVNCPRRYFSTGALIEECFRLLGPWIKSCHAKDILLRETLTVHLDEVCPGDGGLDYRCFLTQLSRLNADTPLMLEHLDSDEQYQRAAEYILSVRAKERLPC